MSIEVVREELAPIDLPDLNTGGRLQGRLIDLPDKISINEKLDDVVCDNPHCREFLPRKYAKEVKFEDNNKVVHVCPKCLYAIMVNREMLAVEKLMECRLEVETLKEEINKINNRKLILPGRA